MFSVANTPSVTAVLSAYTSFAAWVMLLRSMLTELRDMVNKFVPEPLRIKLLSIFGRVDEQCPSHLTLIIDEYNGGVLNQMFEGAEIYLRTKISPSVDRIRVDKFPKEKNLSVSADKNQDIFEVYQGIELKWRLVSLDKEDGGEEPRYWELSFPKNHKEVVLETFLPHVLERSKAIKSENKTLKLYLPYTSLRNFHDECERIWGSIDFDHPATFDTLAMDPDAKKELMEDLDRFLTRKDFYRTAGKAWKRGYLLYGPPGTGKSTLIAAMANYLKFNIYNLELSNMSRNIKLRETLISISNRSIIVIEDIDCTTVDVHDRAAARGHHSRDKVTLSGLLNIIDGLWASYGEEKIVVFTTNYKDQIDPALLRPGRMDMHIHMSYCTPPGFRLLASNYLGVKHHQLFEEIEEMIKNVNVTPAEVAEELLQNDDAEIALKGLLNFLNTKTAELRNSTDEEAEESEPESEKEDEKEKDI